MDDVSFRARPDNLPVHVCVPFPEVASALTTSHVRLHPQRPDGRPANEPNSDRVEFYAMPHPPPTSGFDALEFMPHLRVIQLLTSGVDGALPRIPGHVVVCNAPTLHDRATAEAAMTHILAVLADVPTWVDAQREERWATLRPRKSLAGSRVLLLGYGHIGKKLHTMLLGFDVSVVPMARTRRPGVEPIADLYRWLPIADIVVVSVPLTPATQRLVGPEELALMKDGAVLVNVSRGAVVDTAALERELRQRRLHTALDVTDPEPLPPGHPLWTCPQLLISPHVGSNTNGLRERAVAFLREQIEKYAAGDDLKHIVRTP